MINILINLSIIKYIIVFIKFTNANRSAWIAASVVIVGVRDEFVTGRRVGFAGTQRTSIKSLSISLWKKMLRFLNTCRERISAFYKMWGLFNKFGSQPFIWGLFNFKLRNCLTRVECITFYLKQKISILPSRHGFPKFAKVNVMILLKLYIHQTQSFPKLPDIIFIFTSHGWQSFKNSVLQVASSVHPSTWQSVSTGASFPSSAGS